MLTQTKRDISITAVAIAAILAIGILLVPHAAKAADVKYQDVYAGIKGQLVQTAVVCTKLDMINDIIQVIDDVDAVGYKMVAESAERYCVILLGANLKLEHPFGTVRTAYDGLPVERWIVSGFSGGVVGYAIIWPTHPDTHKADGA